ncbi:MAG: hypothetical protein AAF497_13405 [Planctomycetota bacterium]
MTLDLSGSNREERQVELMIRLVDAFIAEQLELGDLVRDLEALQAELQETDKAWRESFRDNWWNLEQVHAVGLDRDYETTLSENEQLVSESVRAIKELLMSWPSVA